MGIRDIAKRFKADSSDLDTERLQQRFNGLGLTPIGELACRERARVGGEVKRMTVAPRQGIPSFEVVVGDGTGTAVAVFTGRRSIAGVENGRGIVIEGVAREERGRRIMLNPAYTLIAG